MSSLTHTHHPTMPKSLQQFLSDAWALLERHPLEAAVPARRAEHLARRKGDNRAWAKSLFIWGVSTLYGGDAHQALTLFSRALAVYRFLDDEQGQWSCLTAIAVAWGHIGDRAQALETHSHANAFKRHAEFAARARWLSWFSTP